MNDAATIWERVDLPVLRFVAALDYNVSWRLDRGVPSEELPSLLGDEVDSALSRLLDHGLIAAHQRAETSGYFLWYRLRPTPDGLRVLGEWPPSAQADFGAALVHLLRDLAVTSDEEHAKPLRRAAGAVGRVAGNVVFDVARSEIRRAGGEVAS